MLRPSLWISMAWVAAAGVFPPEAAAQRKDTELVLAELRQLQAQVTQLQRAQGEIERLVQQLLARQEDESSVRKLVVDTQTTLDGISRELSVLSARVEETNGRVGNLRQELAALRPTQPFVVGPPGEEGAPGQPTPDAEGTPPPSGAEPAGDPEAASVMASVSPVELYNQAYTDYTQGRYSLAISGFKEVYSLFPDSDLADNAYFWIGDSYMAQRQYEEALEAFDSLIRNYPDSNKLPDAYFKKAMALSALDRRAEAMQLYELVIERFPNTQVERMARQRLQELMRTQPPGEPR